MKGKPKKGQAKRAAKPKVRDLKPKNAGKLKGGAGLGGLAGSFSRKIP